MITDTAGVGIEHNFLVQSRSVGNWSIFHCICCKMDTHAVPNSSSRLPFLLNPTIVVTVANNLHFVFLEVSKSYWLNRLMLTKSQNCSKVKGFLQFIKLSSHGWETQGHHLQETFQVYRFLFHHSQPVTINQMFSL